MTKPGDVSGGQHLEPRVRSQARRALGGLDLAYGVVVWSPELGDATVDGSIALFADPDLLRQLPSWFQPVDESISGRVPRQNPAVPDVALQQAPVLPA